MVDVHSVTILSSLVNKMIKLTLGRSRGSTSFLAAEYIINTPTIELTGLLGTSSEYRTERRARERESQILSHFPAFGGVTRGTLALVT